MPEHYVEAPGLSKAWGRAMLTILRSPGKERAPLTVSVTGASTEAVLSEDTTLRETLDGFLVDRGQWSVATVANTIFPESLWNPELPRERLFTRYRAILPRLQLVRQNQYGTYFGRMITNGPPGRDNQVDFALATFGARNGVRRSVLQVGVFDPHRDHSAAAMRGFPCLQHVSFVPDRAGTVSLNAFYATQYMVSRAYGNYLGLCRLGRFIAHELDLQLVRVTCQIGLAELDANKGDLSGIQRVAEALLER